MESSGTYQPKQDDLTAKDVFKLAGLTYRQIHDWEQRAGIIESDRATTDGWRKFTYEEVIALAICAQLREHLAISLEKTGRIYQWLLCKRQGIQTYIAEIAEDKLERMRNNPKVAAIIEGRRHELKGEIDDKAIDYVVKEYISATINRACNQPVFHILKMAQLGIAIYLVTDQETSMIVSETNLVKSISGRIISKPTLIFQLNDLLNEILEKSGLPTFTLDKYLTSFRDYWEKIEERADLTEAEREVIRLIRERDYQRVTAQVKGGEIIRVEREEDLPTREQDKLEELILNAIREGDHQTITLQKCDGKLMRINRKESIKLGKVTEKP